MPAEVEEKKEEEAEQKIVSNSRLSCFALFMQVELGEFSEQLDQDPIPVAEMKAQLDELVKVCESKMIPQAQSKKRVCSFRSTYNTKTQGVRKNRRTLPTSKAAADKLAKEKEGLVDVPPVEDARHAAGHAVAEVAAAADAILDE